MTPGDLVKHKDYPLSFAPNSDLGLGIIIQYSGEDDYVKVKWSLCDRASMTWVPARDVDLVSPGETK
jgi:hypothetical protein|tara:strand:+ start:220 stop:420 length:201 start_codon:yes stop_codon:yes gene_type:complete